MTLKIYLGTDLVYIPRIEHAVKKFGTRFLEKVYTHRELKECYDKYDRKIPLSDKMDQVFYKRLAGRWAGKEAVVKALGTGWRGIRYTDIEIQRQANGAPQVCLYGSAAAIVSSWGDYQWQLSLSHDQDYCVATAIAFCRES